MASDYPAMLAAIVIDSTNLGIRMTENATTATASLAAGTYYLRGDGSVVAGELDLCLGIKTAIEAATASVNTYTVAIAWSIAPGSPSAVITITRATGADTFAFLWADALTTFDEGLIGFTNVNTALDATAKSGTLSPSCVWVSPEIYESAEENEEDDAFAVRARSGRIRGGSRGGPYETLAMAFALVDEKRCKASRISADPNRAFDRFRRQLCRGRQFELHFGTATGTVLGALSSSTERGSGWHLAPDSLDGFNAQRLRPGLAFYSWSLELWAYVA